MTYAQIYAHEMRNHNKSSEIVLHLIGCKSVTLLDTENYLKLRFESLTHLKDFAYGGIPPLLRRSPSPEERGLGRG